MAPPANIVGSTAGPFVNLAQCPVDTNDVTGAGLQDGYQAMMDNAAFTNANVVALQASLAALVAPQTIIVHPMNILVTTYSNGSVTGPDDPDAWMTAAQSALALAAIVTRTETVAGASHCVRLTDLPVGAIVSNVSIVSVGRTGQGADLIRPTYTIVRWSGDAAEQNLSSVTTDVHVVTSWDLVAGTTSITPTGTTFTVASDYLYALLVTHPYNVVQAAASFEISDVKVTFSKALP